MPHTVSWIQDPKDPSVQHPMLINLGPLGIKEEPMSDVFSVAWQQISSAIANGERVVVHKWTNENSYADGVLAEVGMRVRAVPAFLERNRAHAADAQRYGLSPNCVGTIVELARDDGTELGVNWDNGMFGGNVKAGKRHTFSIMTATRG
tara:strand:+ start:1225 stop:1671 length:447 start_codon:yes stop_codon:yes gene_type:complete